MRKASSLFQHNSVFRSLYDQPRAPKTPPIARVAVVPGAVPPLRLGFTKLLEDLSENSAAPASPCPPSPAAGSSVGCMVEEASVWSAHTQGPGTGVRQHQ